MKMLQVLIRKLQINFVSRQICKHRVMNKDAQQNDMLRNLLRKRELSQDFNFGVTPSSFVSISPLCLHKLVRGLDSAPYLMNQ